MTQQYCIEEFKELVLKLYRGVPKFFFVGFIEQTIPDPAIRTYFFDSEIFVKANQKHKSGQDQYILGKNGILLANSFEMQESAENTEKLTRYIHGLTKYMLIITICMGIMTFISVLLSIPTYWPKLLALISG